MRLIDADELMARLRKDPLFGLIEPYGIESVIAAAPTIEAEPVRRGHWTIEDCHAATYKYCCSECKAHHRARYDYCPTCGAKMEEQKV